MFATGLSELMVALQYYTVLPDYLLRSTTCGGLDLDLPRSFAASSESMALPWIRLGTRPDYLSVRARSVRRVSRRNE